MGEDEKIRRLIKATDKKELIALVLKTFAEDSWERNRSFLLFLYGWVILTFLLVLYKLFALFL